MNFVQKKNYREILRNQSGRAGWLMLWLLGVPVPVLFLLFMMRGCT
ncbi:MAG: hypothetical protein AB7K68_14165 [Bacteriovoracia bacterium]